VVALLISSCASLIAVVGLLVILRICCDMCRRYILIALVGLLDMFLLACVIHVCSTVKVLLILVCLVSICCAHAASCVCARHSGVPVFEVERHDVRQC
jgi:hypothetical protein